MSDQTRYEQAYAEGGVTALVSLALSDQSEMASLANRTAQELQAEKDAHGETTETCNRLRGRLAQIEAMAKEDI